MNEKFAQAMKDLAISILDASENTDDLAILDKLQKIADLQMEILLMYE